jgi:uncharacterized membrane protein YbhN (UPF0104 family)
MNKRLYGNVLKAAAGLLILFITVKILGDPESVKKAFYIDWSKAWMVLVLTLLINVVAAFRWHIILNLFVKPDDFFTMLKLVLMGRLASHTTAQVLGDLGGRALYLKYKDIDMKKGIFTIIIDRATEAVFLVCLAIALAVSMCLNIVRLQYAPILAIAIFTMISILAPHRAAPLKKRISVAVLTLCKYAIAVSRAMLVMGLCGITLPFTRIFIGAAAAQLGLLAGITPGGLGFVEAGWAGALSYFGVANSLTTEFLILQRALIFLSVLSIAFLAAIKWKRLFIKDPGGVL